MNKYKIGDVLYGIYKITDVITDGGTADIYRAKHTLWDIEVAIKIPTEDYLKQVGADEFRKECDNWIELGAHPHIALCYLVTQIDGQLAAISEWTKEGTLHDAIKNKTLYSGEKEEVQKRILNFAAQMLSGIKYAHSRGIINRDIKPQNVLLAEDNIRITDFGFASGSARGGTKKYASPEQINSEEITPETDIYSWALTVIEMYCGKSSWASGDSAGKKAESLLKNPDNAAAAPEEMIELLCDCLNQSPEERPCAEELLSRLKKLCLALTKKRLPDYDGITDLRTADIENNRAVACIEIGEVEKAQKHWKKALEISPKHAESLYNSAISRDEVWFERLEKELESAGATGKNHPEIFAELDRARGSQQRGESPRFKLDNAAEAIAFDDGKHLLVKYVNGTGVSIDIETGRKKISKRAAEVSEGVSELTVGDRTLLAYFGWDWTTRVGDRYGEKTRWLINFYGGSSVFCFSPDGKRFAIYSYTPPDYEVGKETQFILGEIKPESHEILLTTVPEPYSCKYFPSKFQPASKLQKKIERMNNIYNLAERKLSGGDIRGTLEDLEKLDDLQKDGGISGSNIQRYMSLKRELAKCCDKSEPAVIYSKKLMSAPVLPYACAISSGGERFAFLMPDKTVGIYELRNNELKPKSQVNLPDNFYVYDMTDATIWFSDNDEFLAVRYETSFLDDESNELDVTRNDFVINVQTGAVSQKEINAEPPKSPEDLDEILNKTIGKQMRRCYSADGFTALSYNDILVSEGCDVLDYLGEGEDGHPMLLFPDYKLTLAAPNRIDENTTTRKKGRTSDKMNKNEEAFFDAMMAIQPGNFDDGLGDIFDDDDDDHDNGDGFDDNDIFDPDADCYEIPDPVLEQARKNYLMKKQVSRLKYVQEKLLEQIIGQDHAVEMFIRGIFRAEQDKSGEGKKGPKAIFTFAGPPGTGKSMLAKSVADLLNLNFKQFDMSEYANSQADIALIGTEPNYKNPSEGDLTGFVYKCNNDTQRPGCVLLFDEIEKAHSDVLKLFYQILEDGHLTDKFQSLYDPEKHKLGIPKWDNPTVSFEKAIVIFTSNIGRSIYEAPDYSNASAVSEQTLLDALMTEKDPEKSNRLFLPAALVSRLSTGTVIMFNKLKADSLSKIVHSMFLKTAKKIKANPGLDISANKDFEMAMLFSLGGETDARRLSAKVGSFVTDELYSILYKGDSNYFDDAKKLEFAVELPEPDEGQTEEEKRENREVRNLFVSDNKCTVLAYVDNDIAEQLKTINEQNPTTDNTERAADLASNAKNIDIVLIDVGLRNNGGDTGKSAIFSSNAKRWREGKSLFDTIRKSNPETPVYVLNKFCELPEAVVQELIGSGAAGCVEYDGDEETFGRQIEDIARTVHMLQSAATLARAHRQLSFNSTFEKDKESGIVTVKLRNLSLERTPLANDTKFLLGDMDIPKERFSDVIGARLAVEALRDYKKFFENPREFTAGGRAAPKGVLLYGPPGTGKTMLAKAMAGECGVEFIQKNAAEIHDDKELIKLFETARKYAPAIIFLDEVDTIAKARSGADPWREGILNAMLSQMDGFKSDAKRPVFVLAATNYGLSPSDGLVGVLDEAFCRRFDKCIRIELPEQEDIKELIRRKLEKMNSDTPDESVLNDLADRMAGLSPSDINRVLAAAQGKADNDENAPDNIITPEHITTAYEEIRFGEKRRDDDEEELRRTATHEAGHALIYHLCGNTPAYLTIEARGNFGGYMRLSVTEVKSPHNRRFYLDRIRCSLGGRAAEVVIYGEELGVNVGASEDLQQATETALAMVTRFGMDENVGLAVLPAGIAFKSEAVMSRVNEILKQELVKAKTDIEDNKDKLNKLVDALMNAKNHRLTGSEIKEILGGGKETTL